MRKTLVLVSLAVHAGLVVAFLVAGLWHIDRLEAARRPFDLAYAPPPPAPSGGGEALPKPKLAKKEHPKVVVQPPVVKPPDDESRQTEPTTGTGGGSGSAVGPGTGPGTPTDTGTCTDPNACGPSDKKPEPIPQVAAAKKVTVPPGVLRGLRISGETQIQPSDAVKNQMIRDDHRQVRPAFVICIGTSGEVTSTRKVTTSGYDSYDAQLFAAIQTWRYRPYMIGNQPVPACGIVTFAYSIE